MSSEESALSHSELSPNPSNSGSISIENISSQEAVVKKEKSPAKSKMSKSEKKKLRQQKRREAARRLSMQKDAERRQSIKQENMRRKSVSTGSEPPVRRQSLVSDSSTRRKSLVSDSAAPPNLPQRRSSLRQEGPLSSGRRASVSSSLKSGDETPSKYSQMTPPIYKTPDSVSSNSSFTLTTNVPQRQHNRMAEFVKREMTTRKSPFDGSYTFLQTKSISY